jgi:Rod binding domain-containing protein
MNPVTNLNAGYAAESTAHREIADEDNVLRQACRGVEGMFISILLKQGLQTDSSNEEEAGFNGSLREFAIEQTAAEIGQGGGCGIADMIYQQLLGGAEAPAPTLGAASARKGLPHHAE